jgi:hypothetical protein
MLGSVYFMQEGFDGAIKIGWTTNDPERRRDNLQIGNSHQLRLLAIIPDVPQEVEFELHRRFGAAMKRSEWFFPVPELLAEVQKQTPPPGRETSPPPDAPWYAPEDVAPSIEPLAAWLSEKKIRQSNFALTIGMSSGHMSKVMRGKVNMTRSLAIQIELATGGAVKAAELLGLGNLQREAGATA